MITSCRCVKSGVFSRFGMLGSQDNPGGCRFLQYLPAHDGNIPAANRHRPCLALDHASTVDLLNPAMNQLTHFVMQRFHFHRRLHFIPKEHFCRGNDESPSNSCHFEGVALQRLKNLL